MFGEDAGEGHAECAGDGCQVADADGAFPCFDLHDEGELESGGFGELFTGDLSLLSDLGESTSYESL